MTDHFGTNSDNWKYDTRGRLIREDKIIDSATYTTQYAYDGADRIATITYPTSEVVTQTYNGRGLPHTLSGTTAGSLVTSVLYNQLGSIMEINLNNSTKSTLGYYGTGGTYDTTGGYYGRLWEIKTTKQPAGTPVLQDVRHTWDAGANLTQRQDLVSSETENFTYDNVDRLTGVSGAYTESFSYNEIGNITSKNGTGYNYGTKPHAVTAVGSTSYIYDNNGNMTTRGTQTITWDVDNMPLTVTGGSTYYYDGDGNRVKEIDGSTTTVYINQYYEKNITTSEITTHYYLGGKQIAVRKGSTVNYLLLDHLGSTSVIADITGASTGTIRYFPFGLTRTSSGTIPTDEKFTGQRLDSTGLYYYGGRYYDPIVGRFISPDVFVQSPANPQSLNRYTYVFNNPLSYTDPTGYFGWGDIKNAISDVITTVHNGLDTAISKTIEIAQTAGRYAEEAAVATGKGIVEGAAMVTGVAVNAAQSDGPGPISQAADFVAEAVLNNIVAPILNATNAGIDNFDVNSSKGYIETDLSNGGWGAGLLSEVPGDPTGITLPTPFGSAVFINEDRAGSNLPIAQAHEETHVIQQDVLGPLFAPLYFLGNWLDGYQDNPFEQQARQNEDPSSWNNDTDWWDW